MNTTKSNQITDASDWQQSKIPKLSELDSLLRCFICKEYLKAPIITSCNHTFCSHCIREYLINSSQCPLCNTEQLESNLKRVILLEEIVLCFSSVRDPLMNLIRKDTTTPDQIDSIAGEELNKQEISKGNFETQRKRKSEAVTPEIIELDSEDDSTISSSSSSKPSVSTMYTPRKKSKLNSTVPKEKTENINAVPERLEMVECPICQEIMSAEELQVSHIDNCLNGTLPKPPLKKQDSKKSTISSFFKSQPRKSSPNNPSFHENSSSPVQEININNKDFYFNDASKHHHDIKKLPKLDYNSLSLKNLKEKLTNLKLSVIGTRFQLESRYNHYYVLFNSNLDSNRPESEKQLRQKLNQWESSHSAFNPGNGNGNILSNINQININTNSSSNSNISDKNFSVKMWNKEYEAEFKELIISAKKSLKKKFKDLPITDSIIEPITEPVVKTEAKIGPETDPESKSSSIEPKDIIKEDPFDLSKISDTFIASAESETPETDSGIPDDKENNDSLSQSNKELIQKIDFKKQLSESPLFMNNNSK